MLAARPKKIRLGDMLVEQKIITPEQLDAALAQQKQSGQKIGRVLIDSGLITEEELLTLLARQLNVGYVDLKRYNLKSDIVHLIPEVQARRFRVLALEKDKRGLLVGMADPTNLVAYDEVSRLVDIPLRVAVVKEDDLLRSIDMLYRRTDEISGLAHALEQELADEVDVDLGELAGSAELTDAPVVKLLQTMFEDAVQVNASDIHIEPDEHELRIRLRMDGVLRVQTTAERRIASALISRLKLMSGLDISEKRLPQDGRFNVKVRDTNIDVRISTMPLQFGEAAVLRLLNQTAGILDLERLGMPDMTLERVEKMLRSPHGMFVVTGPTGSGKTTTLYAALQRLNHPEKKIITVEDPVEYRMRGINQIQVNEKIGLTFARVLRSMLRHDPDIVLIGEMRDQETVEIGLRAAMTGHFVLSSLHTNDVVSTALRLVDMGAEPYLIAAALRGIVAQRLVRRVCDSCGAPVELDAETREVLVLQVGEMAKKMRFTKGEGCTYCNHTGYRGRVGVYELLEMNEDMVRTLHQGNYEEFAQLVATHPAHIGLTQSAIDLAARGLTTVDEVFTAIFGLEI